MRGYSPKTVMPQHPKNNRLVREKSPYLLQHAGNPVDWYPWGEEAARFTLNNLLGDDGRLFHRYREGEAGIPGMLDDYAFFVNGLLDFYEATFRIDYLRQADTLADTMMDSFWDEENGGLFFTDGDAADLIVRRKDIYDGALPSGNSVAALALLRLGHFTRKKERIEKAGLILKSFSGSIRRMPGAYGQSLSAVDYQLGPVKEIVLAGDKNDKQLAVLVKEVFARFCPNKSVVWRPADEEKAREIIRTLPFIRENEMVENAATVYVCEEGRCHLPVTDKEDLDDLFELSTGTRQGKKGIP